jgi:hypothetical protein
MSDQGEFEGTPEPGVLRRMVDADRCVVVLGRAVLYRFDVADIGMRNLAIVALTDAGRRVDEVAAVFGLTATYVSMLRGRAARAGSAGLVRRRGRPPKLDARQQGQAARWAGQGRSQEWIGQRFGVARSVIGRVLADAGPVLLQPPPSSAEAGRTDADGSDAEQELVNTGPVRTEPAQVERAAGGSARIHLRGRHGCRYAGAMLLHAYLDRVGAGQVFATVRGGPARRYDDVAVLSTAALGFALGIDSMEGAKHLCRAEAGVAVGLSAIPELRTLRTRLGALGDGTDPLGLQRAFAAGMLAADPAPEAVYFVDDHFVPYAGAQPVAKGWNTKRRHAQPGRDDTLVVDARGRAVVFGSGQPTSLASNLPAVLAQLREVLGPDAPILLGFDRGGAYPSAFATCRAAAANWVSYRRAPLVATTATPTQATITRAGVQVQVMLSDEAVQIKDYGPARQLTLFENDEPVLQVLTSDTTTTAAGLLYWLRARWRIENMFKYASAHNGIDALAAYGMDIGPDTRKVTNPARTTARKVFADAQAELVAAERALPQLLNGKGTPKQKNTALPGAHQRIQEASAALEHAKTALRPIPAKVLATDLDPDAQLDRPHLARRGLQMVLRLLAFNAEAWLAEHFNAYLSDPNEYRAIMRNLLHLGGMVDYTTNAITVTLDRPDTPRVARALQLLTEELNATPTVMPGDRRPLTYHVAET